MSHASFDPAPASLDQVTDPDWLGAMLSQRWPNSVVREVTVVELLATQATKVRLALKLDGDAADVPRHVCIKGILTPTGAPRSASLTETRFYRDLAAYVPVRTPACVYAALNDAGDNGVVVMQDVIQAGASFQSALVAFTPDQAGETVSQLARMHAATWQHTRLFAQSGVSRFLDQIGTKPIIPVGTLQDLLDGPRGAPLPASIRNADRLQRALQALAERSRGEPACLVHGDAHAGNIYRDQHGYGIVDWQILQKGEWALDVAYHLAAVLSPEHRRAHEADLLRHYLSQLRACGGPGIGFDTAWTRYRSALIYGYYLWAMTRTVEAAITCEFVRRLGIAVVELDSFDTVHV